MQKENLVELSGTVETVVYKMKRADLRSWSWTTTASWSLWSAS